MSPSVLSTASYSDVVLLCLTLVMEGLIVCFLLFTVESLPVPLESKSRMPSGRQGWGGGEEQYSTVLLTTWPGHLPFCLAVVMLTVCSVVCIYGATASLANCMFGKELIPMGSLLLRVRGACRSSRLGFCLSLHHLWIQTGTLGGLLGAGQTIKDPSGVL